MYHLVLINLENFPREDFDLRRIKNFVKSASQAGIYIIAFGNQEIEQSKSKTIQAILENLKKITVTQDEFIITKEVFEFVDLLKDHHFESLDLDKSHLMQKILTNANLESLLDPENIKLEVNTKVK